MQINILNKHIMHQKGKFVDMTSIDCDNAFEELEDQIECYENQRQIKG